MNILVVDDDEEFLQKCCERLLARNWMVDGARSVEIARETIGRDKFDVVLLDLMLPPSYHQEGIELLRTIPSKFPKTTVIMMTQRTQGTTELCADAMRLGAHYFLDKTSLVLFEKMAQQIAEAAEVARRRVFLRHGHDELLRFRLKDF